MRKFFAASIALVCFLACSKTGTEPQESGRIEFQLDGGAALAPQSVCLAGVNGGTFVSLIPAHGENGHYVVELPPDVSASAWFPIAGAQDGKLAITPGRSSATLSIDPVRTAGLPSVLIGSAVRNGRSQLKSPLARIEVKVSGLAASDRILSATLSFSQAASTISRSALAGRFSLKVSPDGSSIGMDGVDSKSMTNCVSLVSADGIAARDGSWLLSFEVNPFVLRGKAALEVVTQDASCSQIIPLSSALTLAAGETSSLTFDMSDAAKTPVQCRVPSALDSKGYAIPSFPGFLVVASRILMGGDVEDSVSEPYTLVAGGRTVSSTSLALSDGAVLHLSLPAGYSSMSGFTLSSNGKMRPLLAVFELVPGEPEPTKGRLYADGNDASTYDLIHNCGYEYETPDVSGGHASAPFRHITQSYDETLGKYVFNFILHIQNDDDRGLSNVTDRQRNEIKTDSKSPASMVAQKGETLRMRWKFRLPAGMKTTSNFGHVHQLKGIDNSAGTADVSMPLVTYTVRSKSAGQVFQVIYVAPTELSLPNEYLAECNLADLLGEWVEVTETVKFDSQGSYSTIITRISDSKVLVKVDGVKRNLWRTGTTGLRPKWGLYRSFGEKRSLASQLRDETIQFADFSIEKL